MPARQSSIAPSTSEGESGPTIEGPSGLVLPLPERLSGGKEVDKFFTRSGTVVEIRREEGV